MCGLVEASAFTADALLGVSTICSPHLISTALIQMSDLIPATGQRARARAGGLQGPNTWGAAPRHRHSFYYLKATLLRGPVFRATVLGPEV